MTCRMTLSLHHREHRLQIKAPRPGTNTCLLQLLLHHLQSCQDFYKTSHRQQLAMVTADDEDGGKACPGAWFPAERAGTLVPHPQLCAAVSSWEPVGKRSPRPVLDGPFCTSPHSCVQRLSAGTRVHMTSLIFFYLIKKFVKDATATWAVSSPFLSRSLRLLMSTA